eukprot:Clim_evm29s238 gene=Clim_evmTU29s238
MPRKQQNPVKEAYAKVIHDVVEKVQSEFVDAGMDYRILEDFKEIWWSNLEKQDVWPTDEASAEQEEEEEDDEEPKQPKPKPGKPSKDDDQQPPSQPPGNGGHWGPGYGQPPQPPPHGGYPPWGGYGGGYGQPHPGPGGFPFPFGTPGGGHQQHAENSANPTNIHESESRGRENDDNDDDHGNGSIHMDVQYGLDALQALREKGYAALRQWRIEEKALRKNPSRLQHDIQDSIRRHQLLIPQEDGPADDDDEDEFEEVEDDKGPGATPAPEAPASAEAEPEKPEEEKKEFGLPAHHSHLTNLDAADYRDDDSDSLGANSNVEDDEEDEQCDAIICMYDKVTKPKTKNKWKVDLSLVIVVLEGREFVYAKARGELEWWS